MTTVLLFVSNVTVIVCRAARELKNEANAHILNHKNVVTLHASIFEPGHYGIVLEFVPNGCLEEYIEKNKVWSVHTYAALGWAALRCAALRCAALRCAGLR